MSNDLVHFGVMGMKWGVSRAKTSNSSDHDQVSAIRKKGLRNMTDDEVKTAVKRMQLVSKYKKEARRPFGIGLKKIKTLSNDELQSEIDREKLRNADFKTGLRKNKKISQMTNDEVKVALKRYNLEKPYRDIQKEEVDQLWKRVELVINLLSS